MELTEIDKRIGLDHATECWVYTGTLHNGYGSVYYEGQAWKVHRLAWTLANGPVPEGLVLDHLCRNRACCNPDHLEPVTSLENTRRSPIHHGAKVRCKQGHAFTAENTGINRHKDETRRYCRICQRKWNAASAAKRRAARKAASGE
jgi:HNH endonuclease